MAATPNVCWYYFNSNCRYGDRCRFSHSAPGERKSNNKNPYVYVKKREEPTQNWKRQYSNSDVKELIERITEEAKQAEYMWPFSCLSVLRSASNVPGWEDISMEELRSAAYASKASNNFEEYLKFYQMIKQKAKDNRMIFIRPGKKAEEVVRGMFENNEQEPANSQNFSSASNFSFASSQIPAFNCSNLSNPSPFGSSNSFFGAPSTTFGALNNLPLRSSTPFGSELLPTKDPAPGIFAMAAQGFQPTSFFNQNHQPNDAAMETVSDSSAFQTQPVPESPFHQNIFGQVPQQNPFLSLAGGKIESALNNNTVSRIYTPLNELTDVEIMEFKNTTFTLENLPFRPPPRDLC